MLSTLALAGCQATYEADNGPRGPERIYLGPPWPVGPTGGACSPQVPTPK